MESLAPSSKKKYGEVWEHYKKFSQSEILTQESAEKFIDYALNVKGNCESSAKFKVFGLKIYNNELDSESLLRKIQIFFKNKIEQEIQYKEQSKEEWNGASSSQKFTSYGYSSIDQVSKVAEYFRERGKEEMRMNHLIRCFIGCRDKTLEDIFLSDMNYDPNIKNQFNLEGILVIIPRGKNNQTGKKKQFILIPRNKDVSLCPVSCIASHYVRRNKVEKPLMNDKPFSLGSKKQESSLRKAHKELDIEIKSVLHAGRHFMTDFLHLNGVNQIDIERVGLWNSPNTPVYSKYYLSQLPVNAIRLLSGLKDENDRITRGLKEIPFEMKRKYGFHWLEQGDTLFNYLATVYIQDNIDTIELDDADLWLRTKLRETQQEDWEQDNNIRKLKKRILELKEEVAQERSKNQRLDITRPKSVNTQTDYSPRKGIFMDRKNTLTCKDIIDEYLFGLGENRESIRQLDEKRGSSWRYEHKESALYSYRKPIYNLLENLLEKYKNNFRRAAFEANELAQGKSITEFRNYCIDLGFK